MGRYSDQKEGVKATFLGTNGWYDTATGNTPCVFVETLGQYIVFDAGFGFYKAKDLVRAEKPVHLFISHMHLDHLIGLHTLPLFKIPQGIDIYIPQKDEKILFNLLKRPLTCSPSQLPTKIRFHRVEEKRKLPFGFEFKPLRHSVPCYGYKVIADGAEVSYCTDTGPCGNLERLAKKTDLFITECALAPGDRTPALFHITPEIAARVAEKSGAKKLALFHFDPGNYPTLETRKKAQAAAGKIFSNTIAANDGTEIVI